MPSSPAQLFGLSAEYWNTLSPRQQALYFRVRPQRAATYEVDVGLGHIESFLKSQEDDYSKIGGGLELQPDFQRGHVWTPLQQSRYMESLIRGDAPNKILFNCPRWSGDGPSGDIPPYLMQCVDGLQRLTAVRKFMKGEVPVFDGLTLTDLDESPFSPRGMRLRLRMAIYEFAWRDDLLQFYLDLNTGGTVHAETELARVVSLLCEARDTRAASSQPAEAGPTRRPQPTRQKS